MTTITFILILLVGIAFQIYWLATTSLGKTALINTPPRRNAMPFYMPLIPLGVFLFFSFAAGVILDPFKTAFDELQFNFLVLACTAVIALTILIVTHLIVKKYFARGFKGFGLDLRTVRKDFIGAAAKLIAVWPLVLGMMLFTIGIGKLIYGPDFELSKHEELEILTKYPYWWVKLVIVVFAVIVAPIYEEVLFRGHIQTGIRNFTHGPWVAIIYSSILFAIPHGANPAHLPALFVLSMGLGYAYEKSGSLFQAIFMHALFNGLTITAAILQS